MKKFISILTLMICGIFLLVQTKGFAQAKSPKVFIILGQLTGVSNGTPISLIDIDLLTIVETVAVNDGKFTFKGEVKRPTSFWIKCMDEYAILQVENTVIKFRASIKDMKLNYLAEGGNEQALQTQLNDAVRPFEKVYVPAYDSLVNKLYIDSAHQKKLTEQFNQYNAKYMRAYINFGKLHMNSYLGLDIVYRNRKVIPLDSILLLYNELSPMLKNTDIANSLKIYTEEYIVKKGNKFLDFNVLDIEGKAFQLSALKEKYIYLTFGSFGCAPCRLENQYIAKNYARLSKILHIVNFSMDTNILEWRKAAKADGIIWYNVSDMAGMAGKIKTLYDVQAMPTSFLIDKNGMIVERFDGYDESNFSRIAKLITSN